MGFFSNTLGAIGGLFEEAGAAVGDVVEDIGTAVLGPAGTRGATIGGAVGSAFGAPVAGAAIGAGLSADISAAPERIEQQRLNRQDDQIQSVSDAPITEQDYLNLARGRQIYTAGLPAPTDEGTVIDIRYPKPTTGPGIAIGAGMEILEQVGEYFFGEDDNAGAQQQMGMMMCKPQQPKVFNVNRQTGCITITRKQQAKLKEAVRMFGGPAMAQKLGISNSMLQDLLLKTFRTRRKGISGADIRAVKRVDRQMHSLACALGGISQTSRAVASRKSPPKRSC